MLMYRDLAVAFAKKHSIGTPGQPSSAIDKIARHVSMCLENFLKNAPAERVIHEALQTRRQRELANASSTSQAPGAHSVIAGEEMGGKKKQVASPSVASESIPRPATKQSGHKHSPDRSPVHSISPQSASSSSRSSSSRSPSGRGAIAARTREAHVTKPVLTPTASPPLNAENSISEPGGVYRSPPLRSPSPRAAIHRPPIQEHLSVSPSRSALHGSSPVRQAKSADTGADSHSTGESLLLKDMEAEAAFELAKTQWDTLLGQQYPPTAPGVLVGSARNSGSTSSHTLESHTELVPQRGRHPGEEASISSATDGSRHTGLRAQQHSGSESATGTAQSSHRGVGAIGQGCTPAARTAERLFREATVLR